MVMMNRLYVFFYCGIVGFGTFTLWENEHLLSQHWWSSQQHVDPSSTKSSNRKDSRDSRENTLRRSSWKVLTTMKSGAPADAGVILARNKQRNPTTSTSQSSVLDRRRPPTSSTSSTTGKASRASSITHVIHWNGKDDLKKFMTAYFKEKNLVCDLVVSPEATSKTPSSGAANTTIEEQQLRQQQAPSYHYLLNITFGCHDLFYNSGLGTGNYLAGLYAIRLAAQSLGNVDVSIDCPDASEERSNLILPWLTGYFVPIPTFSQISTDRNLAGSQEAVPTTMSIHNDDDVCANIDRCPIGYLASHIQYELRRMAIAMVGIPKPHHPTSAFVTTWLDQQLQLQQQSPSSSPYRLRLPLVDPRQSDHPPLYPNIEMDDAIVHFRCGDLMMSDHPRFGFVKYEALIRYFPDNIGSIGIVTQPFDATGQMRNWDSSSIKRERCRIVVTDFVSYIQEQFPNCHVHVHNSPNETIALTYARMIMASQMVAAISTFGVFPAIANFGTGYIRRPDTQSPTNGWLLHPPLDELLLKPATQSQQQPQQKQQPQPLVLMDEPNILMVRQVKQLWELPNGQDKILAWFRDASLTYNDLI